MTSDFNTKLELKSQKLIVKMSKLKLNNNPGGRLLKMLKSKEKPKAARGLFGASHHLDTPSCKAKLTKDYEDAMHLDDEKVDYGATRVESQKVDVPRRNFAPDPILRGNCQAGERM